MSNSRPRRSPVGQHGSGAVVLFEQENSDCTLPNRNLRQTCIVSLTYFLPIHPALREAAALRELIQHFDPPAHALCRRYLSQLEGQQ